jgi:Holliday junction resolvase RusA-like endonuclease
MGEPFVILPFLPPTSNNIYVTNRNGARFLSKEAKEFKTRAVSLIQSQKMADIGRLSRTGIYRVWYAFFFPIDELVNKTFGSGKKDAASSRYKRMDVENRVKLVADSLATAIGIDDCQFFEGGHSKLANTFVEGKTQLQIFLELANPKDYGLEVS